MNAIFIGNAILLDYDVIEIEEINFSGLVKNTVNTWQANRSVNEKKLIQNLESLLKMQ